MNIACPHCTQALEIDDEWAGQVVDCPSCRQALTVPPAPGILKPKAAPTPPATRHSLSSKPPRRRGGGFWKFLLLLIILAGAGFGYLMVHFKESPEQVWKRLVNGAKGLAEPPQAVATPAHAPAPTSEPERAPEPTPTPAEARPTMPAPSVAEEPAARPVDPLAWLLEHKERAPKEVVLERPATLSIWDKENKIGFVTLPARTTAQVVEFTPETVSVRVGTAAGQISIDATNLRELTKAEQEKAATHAVPNQAAFAIPLQQVPPVSAAATFPTPRFTHPSVPFTREDLELLKVNVKREPWKSGFEALAADGRSKLDYKMQGPFEEVKRAYNLNLYPWRSDMTAVHNLAVMWWFTGNPAYAQKARDILIAYAKTEKVFGGSEAGLDLGDYVYKYVVGADILRGTWPGWTESDTALVKKLFLEVYWPGLGINDNIIGPANKGMLVAAAGAGIAAFCDDRAKLEHVASLVRQSAGTGFLNTLPTGEQGETGRDCGHAYHTWACLAFTAEILWKQGIDIYSEMDNRILANGEYYARNNLGLESPFVIFGSVDAVYWRSNPNPGWASAGRRAMALLHGAYAVRKGIMSPYIERYRQAMPLGGGGDWMYEKTEDRSTATPPPPVVFPATARVSTGLSDTNIGDAQPAGGSTYSDGIWTVTGGGAEVWTHGADSCHFTYKEVSGDCAIVAKLESLDGADPDARAGVMIRSDVTKTAANRAWLGVKPGHKLEFFQHGWTVLWSGSYREKGNRDFPESESYWMKIERVGNMISLYLSGDGASWFAASAAEYKLPATMSIGLMVCSKTNGTPCTARFSHVSITGGNGAPVLAAPAAPRNLMASPGSKQVPLRWLSAHDSASYIVKRSPTKGGPYTTIAKVAGNSYTDADVTNDTTYYYVVSAANSVGESPNSPEDAATPRALMWNVTFGGTASATVAADSADKVFDSNTATRWFAGNSSAGAVRYDFGAGFAPVIERYTVTSANDVPERDPRDWQFQGSNDGTSWTTLDTQNGQTFPARFYEMEYAVAKPAAYRYYRLNIAANSGAEGLQVGDIKLLTSQPIPNAPVSALIHWRANDTADREQAIASRKADEARR